MRKSLLSVFFTAALFFEFYTLAVAFPTGKAEDGSLEQDPFNSILNMEAAERSPVSAEELSKGRGPRTIVAADPSMWREMRALRGALHLFKRTADDGSPSLDSNIPILRRDTMRCMVGRVYRPCWDV